MIVPDIELHEATNLAEASSWMERYGDDARLLAGGTDLLVDLKCRRVTVSHVVSLSRILVLRGVSIDDTGMRIGALTTAHQLSVSPAVHDHFPALLDATRDLAAPQVRNMATVGGNIASAIPSADLPPILMVMNASLELWSPKQERSVAIESFFLGPRRSVRQANEILVAIRVPHCPADFGAAYARFSLRAANACAVAGVAAGLTLNRDQTIREAKVAAGAVAPTPRLLPTVAETLVGEPAGDTAFDKAAQVARDAVEPISDIRGSADYRRELVAVLTRRALTTAWRQAREMPS